MTLIEIVFTSPSTVDAFLNVYGEIPTGKIVTTQGSITQQRISSLLLY